jgi:sulfur carrier protein ThiS
VSSPLDLRTVTAADVMARLRALRETIAAVQVNGKPLGESVMIEPAARVGDPIEVVIAPPAFLYGSNGLGPDRMMVKVYVIAVASDIAVENLIALERGVADAIDMMEMSAEFDATVRSSDPGTWRRGAVELPAYVIDVEMSVEPA